jgi:chaperone BCS1
MTRLAFSQYGAPGSGKTSLIQGIAGELNLDVYVVSLSRAGLDDNSLQELISDLPEHCIALMEDIDAAFHHTLSRDLPGEGEAPGENKDPNGAAAPQDRSSRISLSGLLNALDGVGAQEGRLLFATTNRYEALDAALRRPGRMDVHVEFKLASEYQVGELFRQFYLPAPQQSSSKNTTTPKDENGDRKASDPGYGTPIEVETEKLIDVELPMEVRDQSISAISRRKKRDVKLSPEELDVLVERFRGFIPERGFSMAALQGYLLMHKNQPHQAVECAGKWVEEETAKREARGSSEKKDQ